MFDDLLQLEEVLGVVRFGTHPAFAAPQFGTFIYTERAVVAALIVCGVGLWEVMPLGLPGGELPSALDQIVPWLSFGVAPFQRLTASRYGVEGSCPGEIDTWEKVRSLAQQAPSCFAPVCDGVFYYQHVEDRTTFVRVSWHNPDWDRRDYPVQTALITAYARLFARTNLTPKLVTEAFRIDANEIVADLPWEQPPAPKEDDWEPVKGKTRRRPWKHRRG